VDKVRSRQVKGYNFVVKTLKHLAESRHIHVNQNSVLNAQVWPVALKSCESWTLKEADEERMRWSYRNEVSEIGIIHRQLERPRTVTSDSESGEKFTCDYKGKKNGILRAYSAKRKGLLKKDIIQSITPGSHARSRPKTIWLNNIDNICSGQRAMEDNHLRCFQLSLRGRIKTRKYELNYSTSFSWVSIQSTMIILLYNTFKVKLLYLLQLSQHTKYNDVTKTSSATKKKLDRFKLANVITWKQC